MVMWILWIERNDHIFRREVNSIDTIWMKLGHRFSHILVAYTIIDDNAHLELSNLCLWSPILSAWHYKASHLDEANDPDEICNRSTM